MECVIEALGSPVTDELSDGITTLHYCDTGGDADRFVAIFLKDNFVFAKKSYTVTYKDVDGASGTCELFIKRGSYIEPDSVIEYRTSLRVN